MSQQSKDKLATGVAIVSFLGGILSIVAALSQSNPIFSWIALVVGIIALVWYLVQGLRVKLIIIALGALVPCFINHPTMPMRPAASLCMSTDTDEPIRDCR